MTVPEVDTGRRGFISGMLRPRGQAKKTMLVPLPGMGGRGMSVFWALAGQGETAYVGGDDGLLFRFDGTDWQREASGGEHNIHALCICAGTVYSVGWLGQICLRDEDCWRAVQGGGTESDRVNWPLFDIAACPAGQPWAVGDQGRVVTLRNDQWCEEETPTTANLRCVLPLANGRVLAGGLGGALVERCEGQWRAVETGTGCAIVSIVELGDDSFVAVGGEYSVTEGCFVGRIFLYRDGHFHGVQTGLQLPRLRRVRRLDGDLLIVGDAGTAYRWSAQGVKQIPGRSRYDLHDACAIAGQVLICGDGETLLQEQAAVPGAPSEPVPKKRWELICPGLTQRTLRTLWAAESNHLVAAGDGGEVLHLRGEEIVRRGIPGGLTVHALWGSSARNILAACDGAAIAHFDGDSWDIVHRGQSDLPLLSIYGFGPHDVFAVGDSGYALRYDGLMWHELQTGVRQELYALWGQDGRHLLAVGGGGLVLRFDGKRWRQFTAGTHQDLYAVHGSGLNKLFLAGLGGTLIRFEDNAWHREFTGVRADLHGIASHGGAFFAVGSSGTVLRNEDGLWEPELAPVETTLQTLAVAGGRLYAAGSNGVLLRRFSD